MGAAPSGEFALKWSRCCLRVFWVSLAGRQGCCEAAQWNKCFSPVLLCVHPAHPLLVKLLGEAALPCTDAELVSIFKSHIFCLLVLNLLGHFNPPQLHLPSERLDQSLGFLCLLSCGFSKARWGMLSAGCRGKAGAVGCSAVHPDTPAGRWAGAIPVAHVPGEAAGEENLQNSVNSYTGVEIES